MHLRPPSPEDWARWDKEEELVRPEPVHAQMVAELRAVLDNADGDIARRADIQLVRSLYAAAFGTDALPENRWKDCLYDAVVWALRTRHRDPRARVMNQYWIDRVGVTRGSSGATILPWIHRVCPHVPEALPIHMIDSVIRIATLASRDGRGK